MPTCIAASFAASCGARSGLAFEAPSSDGGASDVRLVDARTDTSRDAPADTGRDAPGPRCPPPGGPGYRLDALVDGLSEDTATFTMAGDGARVFLAIADARTMSTTLVEVGALGDTLATTTLPDLVGAQVSVGIGRVLVLGRSRSGELVLVSGTDLAALRRETATVVRGPLIELDAPGWNGVGAVFAGTNGFELAVGLFAPGVLPPLWRSFGPAYDVRLAIDPSALDAHVLYRAGDRSWRMEAFGPDGRGLFDEAVVLEDIGFERAQLGFSDDGAGQPWVLGGVTSDGRLTLRRFRRDGTAGSGFSAPVPPLAMPGGIALTTAPPVRHRHGYGMVLGHLGTDGVMFHGAGVDFVGDGRLIPAACDGVTVGIASGPCGYLIACSSRDRIAMALAVPPEPR